MLEQRNKKSGQRVVGAADFSLLFIDTPAIMESNSMSYSNIVKQWVIILVKANPNLHYSTKKTAKQSHSKWKHFYIL